MIDPHELRMEVGQALIPTIDSLDDEVVALYEQIIPLMKELSDRFYASGMSKNAVLGMLSGMGIAIGLLEDTTHE